MKAPVYAVGGSLRDRLLGHDSKDSDFLVLGKAASFARRASVALGGGKVVEFPRFNTAFFLLNGGKIEFTGPRVSGEGLPEAELVAEDLKRRDFTINAISAPLTTNGELKVYDPVGGVQDLRSRILRTAIDPESIFRDDPVRILRAFRFAAQFRLTMDPSLAPAMRAGVAGLEGVSAERISEELWKILQLPRPSQALKTMFKLGVYDRILPELSRLSGIEKRGHHHHKDVFLHTMKVVDNVAGSEGDTVVRFAALLHDVAKPLTKRFHPIEGYTFHAHEELGARMVGKIAQRLKLPGDVRKLAQKLTLLHMRPINLAGTEVTDSAIRRLMTQAGDDLEKLLTLCRADITSGDPGKVKRYLKNFDYMVQRMGEVVEKDDLRAFQSPLRGDEIMELCGIQPGPMVGKIKKALEEAILSGEIPDDYQAARDYFFTHKDEWLKEK